MYIYINDVKSDLNQNSLRRELKIRILDFEMLILLHAVHCVDSCISVFDLN